MLHSANPDATSLNRGVLPRMGPPGSRHRSKSTGSQADQWTLHQEHQDGAEEIYLPSTGGVYITKTKNGKPAWGRKKPEKLLKEWDSNLPDESALSRINMGKQDRRRVSFYSQSSGLTTSPSLTHSFTLRGRSDTRNRPHQTGDSPRRSRKSSRRSSSISTLERLHRDRDSQYRSPFRDERPEEKAPKPLAGNFEIPSPRTPIVSLQSLPPPPPTAAWDARYPSGNVSTMESTYISPTALPADPQQYATQLPYSVSLPNWESPHSPAVVKSHQCMHSPVFMTPRSISMPLLFHPHQYAAIHSEPISPTYPGAGCMPAPPLTSLPLSTSRRQIERDETVLRSPVMFSPNEAKKFEQHYNTTLKVNAEEAKNRANTKKAEARREIGNHMQHSRFCAACGEVRPRGYHMADTLKRGQEPGKDYCHRCLRDASVLESADTESSDYASTIDPIESTYLTNPELVHFVPDYTPKDAKTGRNRRRMRRPKRLDISPVIQSESTASTNRPLLPCLTDSVEESKSIFQISSSTPRADPGSNGSSMPEYGEPVRHTNDNPVLPEFNAPRDQLEGILQKGGKKNPKESIRARIFNPVADFEPEEPTKKARTPELNGNLGNTYGSNVRIESRVTAPRTRSRIPRPIPHTASPRTTPNVPGESISDQQTAITSGSEIHGKSYKAANRGNELPPSRVRAWERPETTSSSSYNHSPRIEESACEPHAPAQECKPIREPKPKAYNHRRQQSFSRVIPDPEQPVRSPGLGRQGCSNRERNRQCREDAEAASRAGEGYIWRITQPEPDTPYTPTWDLPPTPTDPSYANETSTPYFMGESWRMDRGDVNNVEDEAETLAEQDLASAGKLFSNLTGSWDSPGTSSFFVPSFVTRTEVSVESYSSYGGSDDNANVTAITYQLADISDADDAVDREDLAKTPGYFTGNSGNRTAANRICGIETLTYRRPSQRFSRSESPKKLSEKSRCCPDRNGSSSSLDPSPPDPESSTIAHTGHSAERL